MKKKILVTRNLLPENEERIKKIFNVKLNKEDKVYSSEEVLNLSKDCDGILCVGGNKLSQIMQLVLIMLKLMLLPKKG